jgi:peptide/nickel transport system permease protein
MSARRRLFGDATVWAAGAVIVVALGFAAAAPLLASLTGHAPNESFTTLGLSESGIPVGPGADFWLGADQLGRDLFVRLAYGARISLLVGLLTSALGMTLGVSVGLAAGWCGGAVDALLARLIDVMLSLPFIVLALALAAVSGPGLGTSIGLITAFSWASVARVVRAETQALRVRPFVMAAQAIGAGPWRIVLRHLLPVMSPTLLVYATLLVPSAIAFESTLSFLGVGLPPPTATWGRMLAEAVTYYRVAWWMLVFPAAALVATTWAFSALGDGLREAFDPRQTEGARP